MNSIEILSDGKAQVSAQDRSHSADSLGALLGVLLQRREKGRDTSGLKSLP
jgi:hypothetical protein